MLRPLRLKRATEQDTVKKGTLELFSLSKEDIKKCWNKDISQSLKIKNEFGKYSWGLVYIEIENRLENLHSNRIKTIGESLDELTKIYYREQEARASKYLNSSIFKKLFGKKPKEKSIDEIQKKLKSKIKKPVDIDNLKINHPILPVGTEFYTVNLHSETWECKKHKVVDIEYEFGQESVRYIAEDEFPKFWGSWTVTLDEDGKKQFEKTQEFFFLDKEKAIAYYNRKVDEFNQRNPKITDI